MPAKKICFLFFIFLCAITSQAQLANTKWKASLQLQDQVTVLFDFKKDTLKAISVADSAVIETMSYVLQDTVLKLKRISGQSSCDNDVFAVYRFKITGNQLSLSMINDNCIDRSSVLDHTLWAKVD